MCNFLSKHPAAHKALSSGEFVVQQRDNGFSQTAVDQIIEQTVNLSTKYKGSIIDYSINSGVVCR